MSWADYYARKAVLDEVLARAATDPAAPLGAGVEDKIQELFGGHDGLLLALQHKWSTRLMGRLVDVTESGDLPDDVWDELAASDKTLRAVLDAGTGKSAALREARRKE